MEEAFVSGFKFTLKKLFSEEDQFFSAHLNHERIYSSRGFFVPEQKPLLNRFLNGKKTLLFVSQQDFNPEEWGYIDLEHETLQNNKIFHFSNPLKPQIEKHYITSEMERAFALNKSLNGEALNKIAVWFNEKVTELLTPFNRKAPDFYPLQKYLEDFAHECQSPLLREILSKLTPGNPLKEVIGARLELSRQMKGHLNALSGMNEVLPSMLSSRPSLMEFYQTSKLLEALFGGELNSDSLLPWGQKELLIDRIGAKMKADALVTSINGGPKAHYALAFRLAIRHSLLSGDEGLLDRLSFNWNDDGKERLVDRFETYLKFFPSSICLKESNRL